MQLLSRTAFRTAVFSRDNYHCVFCTKEAKDAHHILERKLWDDGGYYLDNALCEEHHLACERTNISPEKIRQQAGISKVLLPPHLSPGNNYDKWGNILLPNGQRLPGEFFFEESVQALLQPYLPLFSSTFLYPQTFSLPWSKEKTTPFSPSFLLKKKDYCR